MKSFSILVSALLLLIVNDSHAEGCFGRTSDQPRCNAGTLQKAPHLSQMSINRIAPRITTQQTITSKFMFIGKGQGEWSGKVSGSHETKLTLQILRHGKIESAQVIGRINPEGNNVPFRFRRSVPAGNDWNWRIVASSQ